MRWLPNISFSSSSSSCSSSSSSNKQSSSLYEFPSSPKRNNRDSQHRSRRGIGLRIGGPRVTRQRKLRHLSDHDISGAAANAAEAASLSRSTSTYSTTSRSSTVAAAVPLPLPLPMPLPEPEGNGIARLPSKKEVGPGKGLDDRDRDRDRVRDKADVAGDGILSNSPQKSVFAGHDMKKTIDHLKNRPPATARQDPARVENSEYNFWINVPTRSAPTSPFSSPVLSPQRKSAGDVFPQYNMVPKGNQVWSAPEMPTSDISGLPPPAFFDFTVFSSDNSPIQSPPSRSPRRHTKSPSGPSSPLHPKLSLDPSSTRRESANVHPLPLPPGAAMPSLSSSIAQAPPKPEPLRLWQKGKLIGRGTFGSVYVASNRETGALCAMKEVELFPDDPKSAECIKQLEQEIKVLSQLKHPNIVQYYGSEIVDDHFYIYLEYVHPGSINKYIREHCGAITESVLRNFTRHILSGLAYLHSTKTIHRDIKGANLLVDASGVVKLADFGMAKHLTGQRADLSLKGSPYWMAPELMQAVMQKDNNPDLAFAIDIWSLGCTIIEMFTGKPPWSEYEGAAAMFKVMRDTPPIPESLSPEGKDFLRCCFRRNPAERPSACTLLEHRFLKNWQQLDVPSCSQSFHAMKLTDKPQSPRRRLEFKLDHLPVLPSSKSPQKITIESETGQRLHYETPDLTMASRYSPRSTLEALPSPSPLRSAPSMNDPNLSATSPSNISPDPKYKLVFR